jgi:COP9 signalosome complex subunit 3
MKFLLEGIKNFRPHSECLTPLHSEYVCCCLKAMNFKAALKVLEEPIYDIEPGLTGLTPKDMVLYYYYGGMVYIGLKQFTKAFSFFDTVPTFFLKFRHFVYLL